MSVEQLARARRVVQEQQPEDAEAALEGGEVVVRVDVGGEEAEEEGAEAAVGEQLGRLVLLFPVGEREEGRQDLVQALLVGELLGPAEMSEEPLHHFGVPARPERVGVHHALVRERGRRDGQGREGGGGRGRHRERPDGGGAGGSVVGVRVVEVAVVHGQAGRLLRQRRRVLRRDRCHRLGAGQDPPCGLGKVHVQETLVNASAELRRDVAEGAAEGHYGGGGGGGQHEGRPERIEERRLGRHEPKLLRRS